ncbi:MAG: hypothetical protein U1F49_01490 [Rubrivivax sp.]
MSTVSMPRFVATLTLAAAAARASLAPLAAEAHQTTAPAAAGSAAATPRIDHRQADQERRIDQGVASGQLTGRETRRLEAQQGHIDRVEDRARADGKVTAGSAPTSRACRTAPAPTSPARSTTRSGARVRAHLPRASEPAAGRR